MIENIQQVLGNLQHIFNHIQHVLDHYQHVFDHYQHVFDHYQHVLNEIKTKMYNNFLQLHVNKFANKELIVQYLMFYSKVVNIIIEVFIAHSVHKLEICYVLYGLHGDFLQYNTFHVQYVL